MRGFVLTNQGIEDVAASELKELTGAITEQKKGIVLFDTSSYNDFFLLCYRMQSAIKVVLLLECATAEDIVAELAKKVAAAKLDEWCDTLSMPLVSDRQFDGMLKGEKSLQPEPEAQACCQPVDRQWLRAFDSTFCIDCVHSEGYSSQEVAAAIGEALMQKGMKANLKEPAIHFFVYLQENEGYFGIDFSKQDLSKRDYRIFLGSFSIKGSIAYSLVRIAGFNPEKQLLDPFCRDGVIPIEAALYACAFSPHYYTKKFYFMQLKQFRNIDYDALFRQFDKKIAAEGNPGISALDASFRNLQQAKKNAKIAGMIKKISFSRQDLEWLDTKFSRGAVDCIVTSPVQPSKSIQPRKIEQLYRELFHQAEFVLKPDGRIVLLAKKGKELLEKAAAAENIKLIGERKVMQGKEEFTVLVFGINLYIQPKHTPYQVGQVPSNGILWETQESLPAKQSHFAKSLSNQGQHLRNATAIREDESCNISGNRDD